VRESDLAVSAGLIEANAAPPHDGGSSSQGGAPWFEERDMSNLTVSGGTMKWTSANIATSSERMQ